MPRKDRIDAFGATSLVLFSVAAVPIASFEKMARALRVALTQTQGEEAGDGAGEAADDPARQATAPNRP